jgi:tRNA U34 5-carboxymethylaminomethyl modifying GTPase MnmE/TrmE
MEIKVTIPDNKKNDLAMRRMDSLEKKLDQQYKSFIDKTDNSQSIQKLQDSLMNSFNKMLKMNKAMMSQSHREKMDSMRDEFARKIKSIEERSDDNRDIGIFSRKLQSLERAIKSITLKPQIVRVQGGNDKILFKSFSGILQRLESSIRETRPRMYPSPS